MEEDELAQYNAMRRAVKGPGNKFAPKGPEPPVKITQFIFLYKKN